MVFPAISFINKEVLPTNMLSKSGLAILLSKLEVFDNPKVSLEQYATDSEVAAEILHFAYMNGDIKGKIIADLGCGTGLLGIGALVLGAKKVLFVDVDKEALRKTSENLEFAKENLSKKNAVLINKDVKDFNEKADVVLENPPFGVQKKHADKPFLEKAFRTANVIYSFHKAESKQFIEKLAKDNGFEVTNYFEYDFLIKLTQKFHTRKSYRFKVGCWRMEKL